MNSHSHSQSTTNTSVEDGQEAPRRPRPASKAALLVLLLLIQLATSLYQLPLVRLIERRLCSDFYNNHNGDDAKSLPRSDDSSSSSTGGGIDESLCKVDHVQQHLAWILGAMETAWIVGDFIMAIPLGFIAEKYGQKAVLRLNLIPRLFMLAWAPLIGLGFGETLPISLVILGPCLSFLGGDCVFGSITYSLAAGAVDDYIARASLFGYMSSVSYVTNLLGPGLASATMGTKLWLPFALGICLLLLAVPTISLLPGGTTRPHTPGKSKHTSSRDPIDDDEQQEQQPFLPSSPILKAAQSTSPSTVRNIISLTKAHIHTLSTTFLPSTNSSSNSSSPDSSSSSPQHHLHRGGQAKSKNLPLLLASFLLTALASSDTRLLPQYVSKRYAWRLVDVGYLLSCKAVVNFVLLVFVVPRVLRRSSSRRRQERLGDRGREGYGQPRDSLQDDDDRGPHAQYDDDDDDDDDDRDSSPTTPTTITSQADIKAETRTNILHARICLCVSLVGAVLIASAGSVAFLFPALGIYALGSALPVFTLSLLKSPFIMSVPMSRPALMTTSASAEHSAPSSSASTAISTSNSREIAHGQSASNTPDDQDDTAKTTTAETQLFALVMMTKTLGSLLGTPLMATLWVRGIYLGGAGLGVPYLVSGACYAAAIGVFAFIEV